MKRMLLLIFLISTAGCCSPSPAFERVSDILSLERSRSEYAFAAAITSSNVNLENILFPAKDGPQFIYKSEFIREDYFLRARKLYNPICEQFNRWIDALVILVDNDKKDSYLLTVGELEKLRRALFRAYDAYFKLLYNVGAESAIEDAKARRLFITEEVEYGILKEHLCASTREKLLESHWHTASELIK